MSKLDVKAVTALSMSTVLSSVEKLRRDGLVIVGEEKKKSGGKPRSLINVSEKVCVCGVSYKSGILTAVRADLKGRISGASEIAIVDKSVSPSGYVLSLLKEMPKDRSLVAIGLAMNVSDPDRLSEEIKNAFAVPVSVTSNTGAVAALTAFGETTYPVGALGIGKRVKFALFSETLKTSDVSAVLSPCATSEGRSYGALLSVPTVEKRLLDDFYRGVYTFNGEKYSETRDKKEYSEALVEALSSLADAAAAFASPKILVLFGDYVSEGLFERVKNAARVPSVLRRFSGAREELALGAAYHAMKECVFSE